MSSVVIQRLILLDLSESSKQEINQKLPNAGRELIWLAELPQEWIDHLAGPESNLPIAKVCLLDAAKVACQVDYALEQAYAHLVWFRKECPEAPKESEAHHYGRFYADDATLRLYSATEHVINFILSFLNISDNDLKKYRKNGDSHAAKVKRYLSEEKPNHQITNILKRLITPEWEIVRKYRNDWVHNKPPILDSPGLDYKRVNRWAALGEKKILLMGGDLILSTPLMICLR